jgi:ankyrin repeat protein
MKQRLAFGSVLLFSFSALAATPRDASDQYYEAIRNNDLVTLRTLLKTADVNARDKRASTPLMYTAAFGSADAMRLLLDSKADINTRNAFDATALLWSATDLAKVRMLVEHGADVNARSKQGRTPLMVAAASEGSYAIVKYLVEKGADVNARDGIESNALLLAMDANDSETVKFLLASGADPKAKDGMNYTALMSAAANGNVELVKLLLSKGADVNAVSSPEVNARVKNGPIALGAFTPLIVAAVTGGPQTVKALLDAGANVNAKDVRGLTPLMLAVATDRSSAETVRLLLAKGADRTLKANNGETAMDIARKFQYPPVMEALGLKVAKAEQTAAILPVATVKPPSARVAAERSLSLLVRTGGTFFKEGGCASCHAQNLTYITVATAKAKGFVVDEKDAEMAARGIRLGWQAFEQPLMQRMDAPGRADMIAYALLQMAIGGGGPDRVTDAMIHNLAAMQQKAGNWHISAIARPPMEDGDFSRTALSLRALQLLGPAGRKPEFADRIGRASAWLMNATPRTTEDRTMQLLGLTWADEEGEVTDRLIRELEGLQRADGGWAQTPDLQSDAYATGQVLYALHEACVPATDPVYRRGVEYLTRTQSEDGSWHVASRVLKFQPYFQSGFPYDHDQWISSAATAWATMALSFAAPEEPKLAATR